MRTLSSGVLKKSGVALILAGLLFSISFGIASAQSGGSARLFLSPSSGTFTVGSTFVARFKVDSGGGSVNASEGNIKFDPSALSVVRVTKDGSVFTLWPVEPSFSNSQGTISFAGGSPTPVNTADGTLISVTFRPTKVGSSEISFTSGAVLSADGQGTNVLGSLQGATYTFKEGSTAPPPPPSGGPTPVAPQIESDTHPEEDVWYSQNLPEFTWRVPPGITGTRILVDHEADSNPTVLYSRPLISWESEEEIADGEWYFHIQLRNKNGWGRIAHRKFLVDATPPEEFTVEIEQDDEFDATPLMTFSATDTPSGVEYYEILIGAFDAIRVAVEDIPAGTFRLPTQAAGDHQLLVKAYDRAGNSTDNSGELLLSITEQEVAEEEIVEETPSVFTFDRILIILLLFGILALVLMLFYRKKEYMNEKEVIKRETKEAKEKMHKVFEALSSEIEEQVKTLDQKPVLSPEEKRIINKLHEALDISEEFLSKEIEDIEKSIG